MWITLIWEEDEGEQEKEVWSYPINFPFIRLVFQMTEWII